ncbi:DoxX family membrane protein [Niabella pedocola]|uniref:DoxX family membrane protein n=1 Tax=Niabella pedocola TaxID=1752077 RepID=A0ABS8PKV3_9BACT|nr:DoxX family membrane protein [Niabella pedocola]MCD2421728.1 DoxX family membrane protein [Niabella pedocola]
MGTRVTTCTQLFLRLAISGAFLSAVADRFGLWGKPGSPRVVWGNWENFLSYSNAVNSFAGPQLNSLLAITATGLEILLPLLLITGYKIRWASIATGVLLCCFAAAMTYSFGIKPSLDYSVWTGAAAAFLLGNFSRYGYSIDNRIANKKKMAVSL